MESLLAEHQVRLVERTNRLTVTMLCAANAYPIPVLQIPPQSIEHDGLGNDHPKSGLPDRLPITYFWNTFTGEGRAEAISPRLPAHRNH